MFFMEERARERRVSNNPPLPHPPLQQKTLEGRGHFIFLLSPVIFIL
jgi:hypothetical protein